MLLSVNMHHPRKYVNNEPKKISLCIPTGSLSARAKKEISGMDELGMGVSIYFKLVKSMVVFFIVCLLVLTPLLYIYSCGEKADSNVASLSYLTLGNIGQSEVQCNQGNLRLYN